MIALLSLLLGIVVIVAITALTAWFVAQEFAFITVDRSRLAAAAEAGDTAAARTLSVTKRTSFMLSGAQLGITITGLLVGYVAEPLVGQALGTMLGGVGVPTAVGIAVGTVLALVFSTVVQMVLGELFPKNLAIARPDPLARWLARSTLWYLRAFGWLIWIFDQAAVVLLKILRIEPVHDVEHAATAADLEHIVAHSRDTGDLAPGLSLLLDRILDFPDETVEHAMQPRVRVDTMDPEATLAEMREQMAGGHSRYPLLDEDDNIVGIVDLVEVLSARDETLRAKDLAKPALIVPALMRLPEAVQELALHKQQMACVIDEYGGFDGVVTIEDLAEELVGEIGDEHDDGTDIEPYVEGHDGIWTISGVTPVDEVQRAIDRDLPEGDYETLAGMVIDAYGRLPEVGTVVTIDLGEDLGLMNDEPDWRAVEIEVLELDGHVPGLLRLRLVEVDEWLTQQEAAEAEAEVERIDAATYGAVHEPEAAALAVAGDEQRVDVTPAPSQEGDAR